MKFDQSVKDNKDVSEQKASPPKLPKSEFKKGVKTIVKMKKQMKPAQIKRVSPTPAASRMPIKTPQRATIKANVTPASARVPQPTT